jgi:hypothetical protein
VRYVPRIGASQSCIAPQSKRCRVSHRIAHRTPRHVRIASAPHRIASHRCISTVPHRSRKRIAVHRARTAAVCTHVTARISIASHSRIASRTAHGTATHRTGVISTAHRVHASVHRVHRHRISTYASHRTHVPHRTARIAHRIKSIGKARYRIAQASSRCAARNPGTIAFQARQQRTRYHRGIIAGT